MKSALVALTPNIQEEPESFSLLCGQIKKLQDQKLFRGAKGVAVIHPDLFPHPARWYQAMMQQLKSETAAKLNLRLEKYGLSENVQVLSSEDSDTEDILDAISQHSEKKQADLLILGWSSEAGIAQWFRGGLTEAAITRSPVPVLVLQTDYELPDPRGHPQIVFGVEPSSPPSPLALRQVMRIARQMDASVRIVSVRTGAGGLLGARAPFSQEKVAAELLAVARYLGKKAVRTRCEILEEIYSVEDTLEHYAQSHRALLVVVTSPARTWWSRMVRRPFSRRMLEAVKRPLLVLRTG